MTAVDMPLAVVEDHVDENHRQHGTHTDSEYGLADLDRHHRADDVSRHGGNREFESASDVEHAFAQKGQRRRQVLHDHGYTVGAVGHAHGQPHGHEQRHGYDRAAAGEGIDDAHDDARQYQQHNFVYIHRFDIYFVISNRSASLHAGNLRLKASVAPVSIMVVKTPSAEAASIITSPRKSTTRESPA